MESLKGLVSEETVELCAIVLKFLQMKTQRNARHRRTPDINVLTDEECENEIEFESRYILAVEDLLRKMKAGNAAKGW